MRKESSNPNNLLAFGDPVRLVWLLIVLALFTGIVTVSTVWHTRQLIVDGRNEEYGLKSRITAKQLKLDNLLADVHLEVSDLLTTQRTHYPPGKAVELSAFIEDYEATIGMLGAGERFKDLNADVNALTNLRDQVREWAKDYTLMSGKFTLTYEKSKSSLHEIQQFIESTVGKKRLQNALKIRRYRQSDKDKAKAAELAAEVISDFGRASNISNLSRDINDLVLFTERIFAEDSLDNVADIKDNKILNILSRLYFSSDLRLGNMVSRGQDPVWPLLEGYLTIIFGKGYRLDFSHQAVDLGEDGLFGQKHELIRLEGVRIGLHLEVDQVINKIENQTHVIAAFSDEFFRQRSVEEIDKLASAWRDMILVAVITMLLFLMVSFRVTKIVRRQIFALKEAKDKFEQQANVLHQKESTLTGILRAAPTGICKVRNRIFEWTNEQQQEMTGYSADELKGQNAAMIYPTKEEFEYVGQQYQKIAKEGKVVVETRWKKQDSSIIDVLLSAAHFDESDPSAGIIVTALDISDRKKMENEREELIRQLQDTLDEIKTLSGLLPICASCKSIRDDKGYWNKIELYIAENSDAQFSHSICPDCTRRLYPELVDENGNL